MIARNPLDFARKTISEIEYSTNVNQHTKPPFAQNDQGSRNGTCTCARAGKTQTHHDAGTQALFRPVLIDGRKLMWGTRDTPYAEDDAPIIPAGNRAQPIQGAADGMNHKPSTSDI